MTEKTNTPIRPKATISPEDVGQPRFVKWGHLRQFRGRVIGDQVIVERQHRTHRFGQGTRDSGVSVPLYQGSLDEALKVYRALDALFDGGVMEDNDD